jgi:hypothetical protein
MVALRACVMRALVFLGSFTRWRGAARYFPTRLYTKCLPVRFRKYTGIEKIREKSKLEENL